MFVRCFANGANSEVAGGSAGGQRTLSATTGAFRHLGRRIADAVFGLMYAQPRTLQSSRNNFSTRWDACRGEGESAVYRDRL